MRIFVGELVMASARKEWNGNEIFDDLESALPCYANILVQNVTFILRDILSPEEASNHEILYIRKPLRPERSIAEKTFLEIEKAILRNQIFVCADPKRMS